MKFGAHLPLMDFGGHPYTLAHLTGYARRAAALGFSTLAANDHLVFASPWLDGPTALSSVVGDSGSMTLATTVALPIVRGPVQLTKAMTALDLLSGGRVMVAVGPGSSQQWLALPVPLGNEIAPGEYGAFVFVDDQPVGSLAFGVTGAGSSAQLLPEAPANPQIACVRGRRACAARVMRTVRNRDTSRHFRRKSACRDYVGICFLFSCRA